jgi:hypothetical protein
MTAQISVKTFAEKMPRLMVVSHERSGTHFLMNSLGNAFGYVAWPPFDFDYHLVNINFYAKQSVLQYFQSLKNINLANIIKSHHQVAFFEGLLEQIQKDFHILYIYRDPCDVMLSCWRFMNAWSWEEGPRRATVSEYIRAQPCGQMMRYQMFQEKSMLHRWQSHVNGWYLNLNKSLQKKIIYVRYENLLNNYTETLKNIADRLQLDIKSSKMPARNQHVIAPQNLMPITSKQCLTAEDEKWMQQQIKSTLAQLDYLNPKEE